jgi:hypothetical protein
MCQVTNLAGFGAHIILDPSSKLLKRLIRSLSIHDCKVEGSVFFYHSCVTSACVQLIGKRWSGVRSHLAKDKRLVASDLAEQANTRFHSVTSNKDALH